jgi:hypothetical protein
MEPEPTTALKRLYAAVLGLASEEGRIEERLRTAYIDHLRDLSSESFPPPLRGEWETIRAELAQMYPAERPSLERIDQQRAVDVAQRILLVYDALIR